MAARNPPQQEEGEAMSIEEPTEMIANLDRSEHSVRGEAAPENEVEAQEAAAGPRQGNGEIEEGRQRRQSVSRSSTVLSVPTSGTN
mmetsp:Transcript_41026/g.41718  ORF Transcript_41026/g.41718 Transcript_41026/m.41718 type:complete len:86 (+) Transcript_41026:351-608(+)